MEPVIIICVIVVVLFAAIMAILSRYRKCPSDKVLVIYGKVGTDKNGQARSARCIHGGAAFIVPIIQSYEYMDLTPISINVDLKTLFQSRTSELMFRQDLLLVSRQNQALCRTLLSDFSVLNSLRYRSLLRILFSVS